MNEHEEYDACEYDVHQELYSDTCAVPLMQRGS